MQEGRVQFVKMNRFCSDAHFIKPHLRTYFIFSVPEVKKNKTKQTTNKQTEKISCTYEIEDT